MITVAAVTVAAIAFICGVVALNRRENRRDDRAYQPVHGPRPGTQHAPAGEGAGRTGPFPRARLPARDPFSGDWPTLEQALHHELPVARDWPLTGDTPPEAPAHPPAGAPGGGHVTLVTHDDTALWEGRDRQWSLDPDRAYELAWQYGTGKWDFANDAANHYLDCPWHTTTGALTAFTEHDLDTIRDLVRARDGAA